MSFLPTDEKIKLRVWKDRKSGRPYMSENRGYSTDCWIWNRAIGKNGYGRMWDGKQSRNAHRVVYETLCEKIDPTMVLDHLCRNPLCVNPDHMEVVTQSTNIKRGTPHNRFVTKIICKRGHKLEGENLRMYKGRKHCRACGRLYYHLNKEKNAN